MNKHGDLIYFVFAGYNHYPSGGMSDFVKAFEFRQDAEIFIQQIKDGKRYEWTQLTDITEFTNEPRPADG